MQRRDFLRSAGAAAAVAVAGPAARADKGDKAAARPNILFIITDDQPTSTFGFLAGGGKPAGKGGKKGRGRGKPLTPHIDKLAAGGVYFSRCYVSSSVCTPSRYSCLTGRYASRARSHGLRNSISKEGQYDVQWNTDIVPGETTLAKILRDNGYLTGMVGKWHNGGPREWNKLRNSLSPDADPADPGIADALKKGQAALEAHVRSCGFDYAGAVNLGNFGAHPLRKLRQHNPEWITQAALDFLDRAASPAPVKRKPFYLYLATTLLHGPNPLVSLKADPRICHAGLLDKPPTPQPSRQDVLRRVRAAGLPERLAGATWLDDSVGAVLTKLDQLKLADNTMVIYFNDHGMDRGKGSCYEGGVRTPCFIRWPGRAKPGRSAALVQNVDFAPTILAACGVAPPEDMHLDGVDLAPLLTGRAKKLRDSLYCEIGHTRAVVTDRWKYLAFRIPPSKQWNQAQREALARKYMANKKKREDMNFHVDPNAPLSHLGMPGGQNTERGGPMRRYAKHYHDADQLYNLAADPNEQTNLAAKPAHKSELANMQALLKRHLARVPGTFGEFKTKSK